MIPSVFCLRDWLLGLVYQFNNVAFFCCFVAYIFCLLFSLRKFKISYLYFIVPSLVALPFILFGGGSFQLQPQHGVGAPIHQRTTFILHTKPRVTPHSGILVLH